MFLNISCLFLYWSGPKSTAKLDGAITGFPPLDLPLCSTVLLEQVPDLVVPGLYSDNWRNNFYDTQQI